MADLAAAPPNTASLHMARINMVESQVRTADVTDVRIHDAMREIPRESFVPAARAYLAYADTEAEYAPGRSLLKPRDLGKLLQAIRPLPGEHALAIAAPYAAAVLQHMGVGTLLLDGPALTELPAGTFDIIVCEGAVGRAPQAWLQALVIGGRLGVVERDGPVGKACLYLRAQDGLGRRELFDATPPVLEGFAAQHGFAL